MLLVGALGGAALAGIYRVAAQLGEGLLKLAQALLRATYPELVRDPEAARHIAARIGRIALVTGVVTVAFGALAGHWVIVVDRRARIPRRLCADADPRRRPRRSSSPARRSRRCWSRAARR